MATICVNLNVMETICVSLHCHGDDMCEFTLSWRRYVRIYIVMETICVSLHCHGDDMTCEFTLSWRRYVVS